MKHNDDDWEKAVRLEPFAASPFTEEHKQNVLRQVAWIKSGAGQEEKEETYNKNSNQHIYRGQRRGGFSSRRTVIAGTAVAAIASAVLLWNGQIAESVLERVYPAAVLQTSDDVGMKLLSNQMKKTVAVTMRDYLGKQLLITKVQNLPISDRIYVEAGNEMEGEYAKIWLDAATGNLREVEMRREMKANELEHRFLRQVPTLLQSIGSDPTLKPISARRYVKMKQSQEKPVWFTTLTLQNEKGSGNIEWTRDKAVLISGYVEPERISKELLADAKESIGALSGEPAPALTGINVTRDDKHLEERTDLTFGDQYLVTSIGGMFRSKYSVRNFTSDMTGPKDGEDFQDYSDKLLDIEESTLRKKVEPIIEQMFQINLQEYKLHRNPNKPGVVTFELGNGNGVIEIQYDEAVRINRVAIGDL
ncbi:hypothetical protein [Paenibacillus sp. QZ-Y1]|uniref:hypothetical protein n=1 Tax=Paenibacillus sp. QZ-Y1 TaxID=3414511 RepID=UPI003F7A4081